MSRLAHGVSVIKAKVRTLPNTPGCYRMISVGGEVLYVGKAKDLKKRVTSYTLPNRQANRIQRMIAETATMEFMTTHTEVEALLLEANLIKRYRPRFNVLLRDDKSFPYILITADHPAPQITKHRGARNRPGQYFGPFASAGAVNRTIVALQRAFLLRPCSDSIFASRTRPCLQYQIKRCSAPCVGRISETDYAGLVEETRDFMTGKSDNVKLRLAAEMQKASDALEYEQAARLRDRLQALALIQSRQDIYLEGVEEADIIAAYHEAGHTCIQVFFFRNHGNYGNRAYFPAHDKTTEPAEILAAFMAQFYENKTPPRLILVNEIPAEIELLTEALTLRAGAKVEIVEPQRGEKRKPVQHALANAKEALARRMAENASQGKLMAGMAEIFGLETPPKRIEVYDNSHISGTNAYGCMIVAGPEGFMKNQYRKFSIKQPDPDSGEAPIEPGDDYAMMRQVLTRRFTRALKEDPDDTHASWPDLVLIDGGQGQLSVTLEVFADLGIDDVAVASIAKGPDRNAGRERFFMPGREPFGLDPKHPVLYYLQRLRDEAHRFAIGTHRAKRSADISKSPLDDVAGIGAKRKKALLMHFGSARAVAQAGLTDLAAVPGISATVAKVIYDHFHPN
ncbi:excinuclease ABC subunit UvrC [Dongia rigui]|uniref:UvrABC system protein C n=1 Tax=Dongia rigui TaxID=940149 RepID=A0ABU5DVR2_9PROT|nr:excinuclease ABC subunit UvrC [Dongia rigui]MDY0870798.1 excinuclease ABC subunit UvrC [Dongia rigui]